MAEFISGADVIVGALSPRGPIAEVYRDTYRTIARLADQARLPLYLVGGFSSLRPAEGAPRFVEDLSHAPVEFHEEVVTVSAVITDDLPATPDSLSWVFVSPAGRFGSFAPGERLGQYRVGGDVALTAGGLNHAYLSEGLLRNDPVVDPRPAGSDRDLFVTTGLDGDPVVAAKLRIMFDGELVIYRHGSSWDQFRPAAQSAALARALGMQVPPHQEAGRGRGVVCDLPPATRISAIADKARSALGSAAPRVVGDSGMTVTRACVLAGESDPVETLADLLSDATIDLVVTGAGGILDEVDGGISYFLDVLGTGRRIALLTVGYGPSHEPGVQEMRDEMQRILPELSLEYWPSGDPSWTPQARGEEAQR